MTVSYRPLLAVSGLLLVAGGRLHPDADPAGSVTEELAEMTADPLWVTGHSLIALSTVVLAAGLWAMHRAGGWDARTRRAVRVAAVAVSLYVVETLFHLAAAVDSDALVRGELAPFAGLHVLLSLVLYPVSGAAVASLGLALARSARGVRRVVAVVAVLSGTVHALSVPLALLLPEAETSPLFIGAAVSLALWSLATGVLGAAQRPAPSTAARVLQPTG